MLDWARRRFQLHAARRAAVDLRRQIDVYAGMDDHEVAFLLVGATYCRLELERRGELPCQCLDLSLPRGPEVHLAQGALRRLIRRAQRESRHVAAACLMVWLHSARALNLPEIRMLGREMWQELARGFAGIESAHALWEEEVFDSADPALVPSSEEFRFVPVGLEPTARGS